MVSFGYFDILVLIQLLTSILLNSTQIACNLLLVDEMMRAGLSSLKPGGE